jgi:DNA repair protein RadA
MYRMGNKKSTYSNSHIQEEKKGNSESISDDYAEDIVDNREQLEKEEKENTIVNNTEESLTTLSEQSQINDLANLEIQDIEGIGPTTARKLREAGIFSVMDLAVATVEDLAVDINASKESAASFIMAAQKLLRESDVLDKEFITADTALKKRRSLLRCSTGSSMLDDLFLGGIETQAVTELYGEFGSGKSQICHTMCITAGQPIE